MAHTVMVYTVMPCIVMAHTVMAYTVVAYIVMAHTAMAYIVMAYTVVAHTVMAYTVMACIVMAHNVMAHKVMAYTVMAYTVMACAVLAYIRFPRRCCTVCSCSWGSDRCQATSCLTGSAPLPAHARAAQAWGRSDRQTGRRTDKPDARNNGSHNSIGHSYVVKTQAQELTEAITMYSTTGVYIIV